jgi:hypothetical protein
MKLVLIEWLDAVTDDAGWKKIEDVKKTRPPVCKSVGWILKETKTHITIAATIHGDDCDGDVTIPRGMIRKVTELTSK